MKFFFVLFFVVLVSADSPQEELLKRTTVLLQQIKAGALPQEETVAPLPLREGAVIKETLEFDEWVLKTYKDLDDDLIAKKPIPNYKLVYAADLLDVLCVTEEELIPDAALVLKCEMGDVLKTVKPFIKKPNAFWQYIETLQCKQPIPSPSSPKTFIEIICEFVHDYLPVC
jgi:hypothetical protein